MNLTTLGADFYTGDIHKWLFAPKGCAFLYAAPSAQALLKPLLISLGRQKFQSDNAFIDEFEYQGIRDVSAFLSTSAAINFHTKYCTSDKKHEIYEYIKFISQDFKLIFETQAIVNVQNPDLQFYAHPLPQNIDAQKLQTDLYNLYKVEIPVFEQNGVNDIRISLQIYNTEGDILQLMRALKELKKQW